MTETDLPEGYTSALPDVKFTQRERRGVLLGRSMPQLVVATAAVAAAVTLMIAFGTARVVPALFVLAAVAAFGLWSWRGESLMALTGQSLRYLGRSLRGQTKFRRKVWWRVSTTPLPTGTPAEMVPVPEIFRHETFPGGLADVAFVTIPTRGGFILNTKDRVAAVTVRLQSRAWMLRDDAQKVLAYEGFAAWMNELESVHGLTEAVLRVRVDQAATTELHDYVADRETKRTTVISDDVIREYDQLIAQEGSRAMDLSGTITLVFDTRKLNADIRDSGGGLVGLGAVLADQVTSLKDSAGTLGVEVEKWLDGEELYGMTTTALDPVTTQERMQRFGRSRRELRTRPVNMTGAEHLDHVEFDQSVHQTLWVHEWPRTRVRPGFLQPLLYSGEGTRCLAIQFQPIPLHQALNELASAQVDMSVAADLRARGGRRTSVLHRREEEDLLRREEDLADGFTDERFRAFVTITAESVPEVRRARTSVERAGHGAGLRMSLLRNQQWSALVTAALPIPTRRRRKS